MTIREIAETLKATVYAEPELLDRDVASAFGSDMMSDVLAYASDHGLLLTGLLNPQVIRTAHMQDMLTEWNREAPAMLFGCESAAAEPFIGNLRLSDNRFELNYHMGDAVPLYAYLYHEYLRNFMGNQVSCATQEDSETLFWRTAYSFAAGDALTLVLTPDGDFLSFWGQRDFSHLPSKPRMLRLLRNLTRLYREEAKPYLSSGRMIAASPVECGTVEFPCTYSANICRFPRVLSTAWEAATATISA